MPIYVKQDAVKFRQLQGNEYTGNYYGIDTISDTTTEEKVAKINNAASSAMNNITSTANSAISNINTAANNANTKATQLNNSVQTIANAIGHAEGNGVDPTLTLPNVAAEAKATGDAIGELKSAIYEDIPNSYIELEWQHGWVNSSGVYNPSDPRYLSKNVFLVSDLVILRNDSNAVVYVTYYSEFTDYTSFTYTNYIAVQPGTKYKINQNYKYASFEVNTDEAHKSSLQDVHVVGASSVDYLSRESIESINRGLSIKESVIPYGFDPVITEMRNDVVYRLSQSGAQSASNLWWSTTNFLNTADYDGIIILRKPDNVPQSMYILYYDAGYNYVSSSGPSDGAVGYKIGIDNNAGVYFKFEFGGNTPATESLRYNCVLCVKNWKNGSANLQTETEELQTGLTNTNNNVSHYQKMARESVIPYPDPDGVWYFETGSDHSVYWHFNHIIYYRGQYPSKEMLFRSGGATAGIYLDQVFTLVTSPKGHEYCLKIPHNNALVYDYSQGTVAIKSILNVNDIKDNLILLEASMGRIVGGILMPWYIKYIIENGNALPYYWKTYLNSKIDDVKQLVETSNESFIFVTDVHTPNNFMHSPDIIRYIRSKINIPYVFVGGDYGNKADSRRLYLNQVDKWFDVAEKDWFSIRGNHDNNYQGTGEVTAADFYVRAIKPLKNEVVVKEALENVYYVDDKNAKFRFICLDTIYEGTVDITPQITWMKERINELPSGWSVIVFSHMYFVPSPVSSGQTALGTTNLGAQIKAGLDEIYDSCSADIVGLVVGHCHRDYYITSVKGYPIIATTCDAQQSAYWDINYPNSITRTTTEQAFDIFGINKTNRTITALRIGRGAESRTFQY